jgi:hypothetical protein
MRKLSGMMVPGVLVGMLSGCLSDSNPASTVDAVEVDTPPGVGDVGDAAETTQSSDSNEADSSNIDSSANDTALDTTTGIDTTVTDTGTATDTSLTDTGTATDTAADTTVEDTTVADTGPDVPPLEELPLFSFFVTSIEAMRELSGSDNGFGGDLRFGETTGLQGADKICATIAEKEMPGASQKRWRAFLSVSDDGSGNTVHAIDRIGTGPWYDRNGRLIADNVDGLRSTRPAGNAQAKADLPNERGEGQKTQPGPNANGLADNHDVLTGSTSQGRLESANAAYTCNNWTSTGSGRPRLGHSWPANSGQGWIQAHPAAGCQAVVNITQNGPGDRDCEGVGCGGGYGALYCFAEVP